MSNRVAIVIPIWKSELTHNEEISLRQCLSILNRYDFIIVTYKGLQLLPVISVLEEYGVKYSIKMFAYNFFIGVEGYNKLMLSIRFYYSFIKYKYILIHQLDCFVFKDELTYWTQKGYSYIGAPWLEGYQSATSDAAVTGVGNGGFSLRHVFDHLRVLFSFHYIKGPRKLLDEFLDSSAPVFSDKFLKYIQNITINNNTFFLFNDWNIHEDVFWGVHANSFTWYLIPEWEVASRFSIEMQPRRFVEVINGLPFACHAWWRYDLEFWKPYIENFNYKIEY